MAKKKVQVVTNTATKLPVIGTAVVYLMLDKFQAPGWIWGIVGTLVAIYWIASIYAMCNQEGIKYTTEKEVKDGK